MCAGLRVGLKRPKTAWVLVSLCLLARTSLSVPSLALLGLRRSDRAGKEERILGEPVICPQKDTVCTLCDVSNVN